MARDNTPLLLIALHPKCKLFEIERGLPEYLETPLRASVRPFVGARARALPLLLTCTRVSGMCARAIFILYPGGRCQFEGKLRKLYDVKERVKITRLTLDRGIVFRSISDRKNF